MRHRNQIKRNQDETASFGILEVEHLSIERIEHLVCVGYWTTPAAQGNAQRRRDLNFSPAGLRSEGIAAHGPWTCYDRAKHQRAHPSHPCKSHLGPSFQNLSFEAIGFDALLPKGLDWITRP